LTKEQVSTLRPGTTAALERTAYRRFKVVKELRKIKDAGRMLVKAFSCVYFSLYRPAA
jgi:hypothetical protein